MPLRIFRPQSKIYLSIGLKTCGCEFSSKPIHDNRTVGLRPTDSQSHRSMTETHSQTDCPSVSQPLNAARYRYRSRRMYIRVKTHVANVESFTRTAPAGTNAGPNSIRHSPNAHSQHQRETWKYILLALMRRVIGTTERQEAIVMKCYGRRLPPPSLPHFPPPRTISNPGSLPWPLATSLGFFLRPSNKERKCIRRRRRRRNGKQGRK